MTGAVCAALLAVGGIACSPDTSGQPTTSAQPAPTTPPPVDGFPDVSTYAKADLATYEVSGPPASGASMLTPDGMTCWLSAYPMPEYASISCAGPRPDKGPGIWNVTTERNGETSVTPSDEKPTEPPSPLLPALHVLYYESDVFCGVDDGGTTACRVGDHGFVLTPTSTRLF